MLSASLNKTFPSFLIYISDTILVVESKINQHSIVLCKYVSLSLSPSLSIYIFFSEEEIPLTWSSAARWCQRPPNWRLIQTVRKPLSLHIHLLNHPAIHTRIVLIQATLRLLHTSVGLLVLPCTRQCRRPPLTLLFHIPGRGTGEAKLLCQW